MHFNNAIWVAPACLAACTASSISSTVAMPVDMISGLPVPAIFWISAISTSSKEASLCAGTFIFSRKSTALSSKRSREKIQAQIVGHLFELGLPIPGRIGLAVQLVQRAAIPKRAPSDAELFAIARDRHGVRSVGLQLDRIRTRVFGGLNDANRLIEVLVVIGGELSNNVDGAARPDSVFADVQASGHH